MKHDTVVRTTVRLPSEIHRQLKTTAAQQHTTCEAILLEAVRRELQRRGFGQQRTIEVTSSMNAVVAELFLQSMPTFALMKDRRGKIEWVNMFFESALKAPLVNIVGSTITEAGLIEGIQKETIDENIRQALRSRKPRMSVEGMDLKGLGPVTVRAQRYVFDHGRLGDISFVEGDIKERRFDVDAEIPRRMERTIPEPGIEDLFVPFLETAPIAIAIKKPVVSGDSVIIWANTAYLKLANGLKPIDVFGRTTRVVFGLPTHHPIVENEQEVIQARRARMAKEALPNRPPRWSLRFPIFDREGGVALIGVVSPDFQQNAATRL